MVNVVWIVLILIALLGFVMGLVYYLKPEYIVLRRIKKIDANLNDKDPEFEKWLGKEYHAQITRTKKVGKMMAIFEFFWLAIILYLYFSRLTTG